MKIAGGLGKKTAAGTIGKSKRVQKAQDAFTRGQHTLLKKTGFRGTAMQKQAAYERKKEERMKEKEGKYGDLKSIELNILEGKARSTSGTKEDRALWLKAAAAQGELGDEKHKKTTKDFMQYGEHAMSKKEMDEITDNSMELAMQTRETREKIKDKKDTSGMSEEEKIKFNDRATSDTEKEEMIRTQVEKEKMNDLVEDGKTHKLQDLGNARTAKIYNEVVSSDQKKNDMNRMSKKQKSELAGGYMANAEVAAQAGDDKSELKFKTKAVEAGKELQKAFESCGKSADEAAKDIAKVFDKFDAKRVAKFSDKELRDHSYSASNSQSRAINRAGKEEQLKIIKESKQNEINRIATNILWLTNPDDVEQHEKMEKGRDNIDSMVKGDKF